MAAAQAAGGLGPGAGVAAIGETGLDYHLPRKHRLTQLLWFRYQLGLARRLGLPLVLHIRMADRDALAMLRRRRRQLPGGVVHCFQGDWDTARAYLDLGFCLGIGGALLRRESEALRDAVAPRSPGPAAGGDRQPLCAAGRTLDGQQKIPEPGAQLLPAAAARRGGDRPAEASAAGNCGGGHTGKYPAGVPPVRNGERRITMQYDFDTILDRRAGTHWPWT